MIYDRCPSFHLLVVGVVFNYVQLECVWIITITMLQFWLMFVCVLRLTDKVGFVCFSPSYFLCVFDFFFLFFLKGIYLLDFQTKREWIQHGLKVSSNIHLCVSVSIYFFVLIFYNGRKLSPTGIFKILAANVIIT